MFKINWYNSLENIIFYFVGSLITALAFTMFNKSVEPTIQKAIDKETVKKEVNNEINTGKIKNVKDLDLLLKPSNEQKATIKRNEQGLLCIDTFNLSNRNLRRLKKLIND